MTVLAGYEVAKRRAGERNRRLSLVGRDIGPMPAVVSPTRRGACRRDFRRFCDSYYPDTFNLPWSADHLRVLARVQSCVLEGGQFALAMPRASGKTSIAVAAVVWALVYAHRRFVVLIGSTEGTSEDLLDGIKQQLETNDALGEDFPSVCVPIRDLGGITHKCAGQLSQGERTLITWTQNQIVLPTIPRSDASAGTVRVAGITGRIRGLRFERPDGQSIRPDLVIVDDPQTDASARSLSECAMRERVLAGAVLGLAGPAEKIAALMPCTVIRPGDVADNILDREQHPEWNGERTRLVYQFPTDETAVKLWERYAELRADSLREHGDIRDATEFYRVNREAMDKGAVVAWPERFYDDELSALQHAMNLRLADEASFQAEYQNDPIEPHDSIDDVGILGADEIARRLNGYEQGVVPPWATILTASIDVQQRLLYWKVAAWGRDFTGAVIDYGTFPEQTRERFTYADADRTLETLHRGKAPEDQVSDGLVTLTNRLCESTWIRHGDGEAMRLSRCLVDANWATDHVKTACQRSAHTKVLWWSRGRYFGLAAKALGDWERQPRDRSGYGWRANASSPPSSPRELVFDSALWKTFIHARLATEPGEKCAEPGSLTLWGKKPGRHRMLSEHLTAETRERLQGNGRVVDVWTVQKHRDNHLLDTLVGCAVAASEQGAALRSMAVPAKTRKAVSFSEMQAQARARRQG